MAKDNVQMLKELFEAHLEPIRADIQTIKVNQQSHMDRVEEAHKRIDAWENRALGVLLAIPAAVTGLIYFAGTVWQKAKELID